MKKSRIIRTGWRRWLGILGAASLMVGLSASGLELVRAPVNTANTGEIDSATLKTDAETDRLFSKAEEFVDLGRFDLASVIWQKVLDEYGDNLITREEWKMETLDNLYQKYLTVRQDLESNLPLLSKGALSGYRLTADAEAKALLAAAEGSASSRMEALAEVVRRYFLSSVGDDAAYELGCLKMERFEFFPALYLFQRVLDSHPDSSVPESDLLIRIAVARAYVGDVGPAERALEKLDENIGTIDPAAIRAVKGLVADVASKVEGGGNFGSAESEARPAGILETDLSEDWVQPFKLNLGDLEGLFNDRPLAPSGREMSRNQLLEFWKNNTAFPAGEVLVYDGRLYFKNTNRLVCVSSETGEIEWLGHPNDYAFDKLSATIDQKRQQSMLFKDRVHQSMGIWGDKIFTLQGRPQDVGGSPVTPQVRGHSHRGMLTGRHRENWLAAYHRVDGRLRWYRQAKEEKDDDSVEACFIGPPAFYESMMLVPMLKDGVVYLAGLNPNDGKTIWLSYLCQEPMGAIKPESPVKVVVDAGEAYVATGSGVVFSLDALSGSVRWCVRYPRSGSQVNSGYGARAANIRGWKEDDILVSGDQLVVLGCDMDYVFSLTRSAGDIAWESARSPFSESSAGSYLMGKSGNRMFVGGSRVVRCYDINGGRLLWQTEFDENSYGKGTVAADGIYIPVGNSIARINIEDGKIIKRATFTSPVSEPIGNLTASGKRLFGFGLERVYAFGGLEQRFNSLDKEIKEGKTDAYKTRMRLYLQTGDREKALVDLNGHFDALVGKGEKAEAATIAYEGIRELGMLEQAPQDALKWVIKEAEVTEGEKSAEIDKALLSRRSVLNSIFLKVEKGKASVEPSLLLDVAPHCNAQFLLHGGRRAMFVAAANSDPSTFKGAIEDANPRKQMLASAGLKKSLGEEAIPDLKQLLTESENEELQLHLSTDLVNLGDRSGLKGFVDLLEGDDAKVRRFAAMRLKSASGKNFPFDPNGDPEKLKAESELWRNWVEEEGLTAELNLPLKEGLPYQGHSLVIDQSSGSNKLIELDDKGKEVRNTVFPSPVYSLQKLQDGNILISFADGVREYTPGGDKVWELAGAPSGQKTSRRLQNGNTLVAQYNGKLAEYDHKGKVVKVWRDRLTHYSHIELTEEDTVMFSDFQKRTVEELKPGGEQKSIMTFPSPVYWSCKSIDGATVVAFSSQSKVTAFGPDEKELWSVTGINYPRYVQALPDGNFAILHRNGITEVDSTGKVVSEKSGRFAQLYKF